jgi:hypothetical protein
VIMTGQNVVGSEGGRLYGALLGTGDVVDLAPSSQGTLAVSSPLTHKPWATSRIVDTIFRLDYDLIETPTSW